jgi:SAM-dependent methyltransferase
MGSHDTDYRARLAAAVLDEQTFLRLTASGRTRGSGAPWIKVVVRPVLVRGRRRIQFSYFDGKKDITKSYFGDELTGKLDELLAMPFRQFHLQSTTGDLYVRISKQGKVLVGKARASLTDREPHLEHDRTKRRLLPADSHDTFLRALGITDQSGKPRAGMQGKFHQINEFLRLTQRLLAAEGTARDAIEIVDCGCGNAYLTFAAYHYLSHLHGLPARVTGIDTNGETIANCNRLRDSFGWEGLEFRVARIAGFVPSRPPDVVLSLHACDTATDEAIAQGVRWGSRGIVAAPCCQHELHDQLKAPVFRPVLRHGILRQRTADILTDALRALVLRIMGYRTDVVEFVSPEHTSKNLMIRAEKGLRPGQAAFVREYQELKQFWGVEPVLEELLGEDFRRLLHPIPKGGAYDEAIGESEEGGM